MVSPAVCHGLRLDRFMQVYVWRVRQNAPLCLRCCFEPLKASKESQISLVALLLDVMRIRVMRISHNRRIGWAGNVSGQKSRGGDAGL
jgi:hypothetical protein